MQANVHPDYLLSLLEVQVVQQSQALLWHLSFLLHQQGQGDLEDQQGPGKMNWYKSTLYSDSNRCFPVVLSYMMKKTKIK